MDRKSSQINTDFQNTPLVHGQIVILKHVNEKTYLYSQNLLLKQESSLFFKKQQQEKFIVGAQPALEDVNNLWQVLRTTPKSQLQQSTFINSSEIHYDDCILLRHFITCRYLTSYGEINSQVTKQGEVSCLDDYLIAGEQIFMIQRIMDPYIDAHNPNFVIDNRVYSHTKMRIINMSDNRALHTHPEKYSQSDANNLKEVTSFPLRDDNDFWEMQVADEQLLRSFKILQNNLIIATERLGEKVNHQDKVIVRSCFTGNSLHSHSRKYLKGSKEQEVTCRVVQPRDENDWWQIVAIDDKSVFNESGKFNQIKHLSTVGFIHTPTDKYLTASSDFQSPSGKGIEVCCKSGSPKDGEWQLIGFTNQQQIVIKSDQEVDTLPLGYPFLIKHLPSGQYLTVFKNFSKPSDAQMEMGLIYNTSYACLWQIEQQDSIFC